jgi:hypothetical protein
VRTAVAVGRAVGAAEGVGAGCWKANNAAAIAATGVAMGDSSLETRGWTTRPTDWFGARFHSGHRSVTVWTAAVSECTIRHMPATAFADRTRAPATYRVLRRVTLAVVAIWVPLALWSGYRAVVQVFSLRIQAPAALVAGATLQADVVTSGRAHADISLELVQGSRVVLIGRQFFAGNRDGALDPRLRRGSLAFTIAPAHLEGWASGPLTIRATAVGRHQWMRLPPPTVREVMVQR